jgi:DNA-binding transcriptional MocR family regulator
VNASLWATRVWHEFRAGNLTRAFRDVLLKLNAYARGGVAFPSQATLAARTACSVRTVARALAVARDLDLISWAERRVRRGWRWLRTSNVYRLVMPQTPVQPQPRPPRAPSKSSFSPPRAESPVVGATNFDALSAMLVAASKGPDLLAARRAAFSRQSTIERIHGCP